MTSKTKTCTKKTQTKTLKTSTGVKVLQNCRGTDKTLSNKGDEKIKDAIELLPNLPLLCTISYWKLKRDSSA